MPTSELHKLQGYAPPRKVELVDRRGEAFAFDSSWAIELGADGGSPRPTRFESIDRVDATHLEGTVGAASASGWIGGEGDGAPRAERVAVDLTGTSVLRFIRPLPPAVSNRRPEEQAETRRTLIFVAILGGVVVTGVAVGVSVYAANQLGSQHFITAAPVGAIADRGVRVRW